MDWTRRRFLLTAALLPSAAVVLEREGAAAPAPLQRDDPAYLVGDPYLAAADDVGLGGGSFAEARERALRFRTPAFERDCYALGVDPNRA